MTETQTVEAPEAQRTTTKRTVRMPFLDWTRGLAATIMLQGHVFHSFARPELRESGPYVISQFIGGIAPAIFLFLTGVTLAFMMHSMERKLASRQDRLMTALRRAAYLGVLAFAFRIQLFLFGWPYSPAQDLLKVDILNCMALAIVTMSGLAVLRTPQRVHAGVVVGLMIACASPLVAMLPADVLSGVARMYLAPDANYFAYFPWAAFLAFGISAGSVLKLVKADHMHRLMQWSAILGFGLIVSAQYFSNIPYSLYPAVDFWINSPGLILIKLGVIMVVLAVTFLWTHHGAGEGWSWVRQLGTTSLLVYWVHIELVYGRWLGFWKEGLTLAQCSIAAIALILTMIGLSYLRTHGTWRRPAFGFFGGLPESASGRVSGD
ncbi:MAG TPA: heparan-alpha-glucosaminide N-acetyltransferase domain-containing protein [Bryobacteraceae bacterium]|nr:heparan-alpha-glucosaminide N-acetyltransferase domain-containing protein [Bryobacteraceae bacterium]